MKLRFIKGGGGVIEYPVYLPSRRQFREYARNGASVPVGACLPLETDAQWLFQAVRFEAPHILLESARTHPVTGRYSILVGEPVEALIAKGNETYANPLVRLQEMLDARRAVRIPGFPPFVGGAVGFLGFDCCQYFEPIPLRAVDDLHLPDLGFYFFNEAVVLDHLEQKLWIIALAASSNDPDASYDDAVGRIDALLKRLTRATGPAAAELLPAVLKSATVLWRTELRAAGSNLRGVTHGRAEFEAMVRQAKEFIARGEIYQVNLSQRFVLPMADEPWALYQRLTSINPSPFAAYADLSATGRGGSAKFFGGGAFQIISASPERFLRVTGQNVETRPIAGTRPKGKTAVETTALRRELILNEKERAEHLMLVDLERNDLGRVCRYGSVHVNELMTLEEYSHVIHIVSNVRGSLRPESRFVDWMAAAFPGGTITGCPKIRAIEIIDALEPVRRQLYTGALGYVSDTGDIDFNLLIRTAFSAEGSVYIQVGAGIVADSDPSREYDETLHKAQALMEVFGQFPDVISSEARDPQGAPGRFLGLVASK